MERRFLKSVSGGNLNCSSRYPLYMTSILSLGKPSFLLTLSFTALLLATIRSTKRLLILRNKRFLVVYQKPISRLEEITRAPPILQNNGKEIAASLKKM